VNQTVDFFPVPGVRLGTACAGIKQPDRRDLVLLELAAGSRVAAVFTRNAFCAAPVMVAKQHLAQSAPRYLLVNTGYANAGTGAAGLEAAQRCCTAVAEQAGCAAEAVLPFSTGVIGESLPVDTIIAALPTVFGGLRATGWEDAAWGIMTTDTVPKLASRQVELDGQTITITGMAKGAGMIRPDMATMLAFIATDAKLAQQDLQACLEQAVAESFNRITVDGDTSTNDACVLAATGQAGPEVKAQGLVAFGAALNEVCVELAKDLVRDGEGATKLINVQVNGGQQDTECFDVAYTIAHSPLVKTAFFAADPNWGRILAAVGRAGLDALDIDKIDIYLDEVCIVRQGARAVDYTEAQGQAVMDRSEITVRVELGRGPASANVWTCDFSYDYIRINAEYRT
jgi:glutamate N-acetyltransferase/amino-acid N-acetyltransferase